jgi:hypothetical protein
VKKSRTVQTILLTILISVSVFAVNVSATPEDGVAIWDFHMGFFLGHSYDETTHFSYDFYVQVHNLNDPVTDHLIPNVHDSSGNLLVDVVVADGYGSVYSVNDPARKLRMSWDDPNNDHLTFSYSAEGSEETVLPIGIYTAKIVRLSDGAILDTASFNTYYKDVNGEYSFPPPKYPIQIYPAADSTISDTTPTFSWQFPTYQYEGDFFVFRASTWWSNYPDFYEWGIFIPNTVIKPTSMTFPNAPEVPNVQPYVILPPGELLPPELP